MKQLLAELRSLSDPAKIATYKNFHKTHDGGYAAGEEFLGLTVPQLRVLAEKYHELTLVHVKQLLGSHVHEEKYVAALILVHKYQQGNKKAVVDFCLTHARKLSGWDLVDSVAPSIFGDYYLDKDRSLFTRLARSHNLWERRIAIVSTYGFIRKGSFDTTLEIADLLIHDTHDLIHKAVGWMLREVGKRDALLLKNYLKSRYKTMPRTMLRYAIERFPETERKKYLRGTI